ncbi:MAG: UvrD-helicase domain-containing protein [Kiritimatiellia bacterium]|nr:UvrD-helicase domain-containing protein [Kiritimatiellia bacterium]
MTPATPGHLALTASAGSGKTYQLTARVIGLMSAGVLPERIVALTFTRKSAGEIFARLVTRLAQAARSAADLKTLNASLPDWAPALDAARAGALLRALLEAMPRLTIGTLDSFFYRIAGAFCFELGLPPDVEILDGYPAEAARHAAMDHLFGGGARKADRKLLAEAVKQASFGVENKKVYSAVRDLVEKYQEVYGRAPVSGLWGEPLRIWPTPPAVFGPNARFEAKHEAQLRQQLQTLGMTDAQTEKWNDWLTAYRAHTPGTPMAYHQKAFIEKLIESQEDLSKGAAVFPVARKKMTFDAVTSALLVRALEAFLGSEYAVRLERTKGLFRILSAYDQAFDREARSAGRLLFQDLPRRLAACATSAWSGAEFEYRLDGRYDHWLLDEFQDTSTIQWAAMRNLAEEVIQTADGSRSFFYVGDVKQSIYGWRQGDPRLFHLLRDQYSSIRLGPPLATSWRSSPVVLDAVNAVLDPKCLADLPRLPAGVADRWAADWATHQAAGPVQQLTGYVVCYELPRIKNESKEDRWERTLTVLADRVASTPKDLSRAVLMRSNAGIARVVEALRARGIRVVSESSQSLADTPMVEAFLALVRWTEHPGDVFALRAMEMSPFGQWAAAQGHDAVRLRADTLRTIREDGVSMLVRQWQERLPSEPEDPFTPGRWARLLDAACAFETQGGGSMDAFEGAIRAKEIGEAPDPEAVRVLTIHKAKGLEYDVVFLPELAGDNLATSGGVTLAVKTGLTLDRNVEWVFQFPSRDLASADPVLRGMQQTLDEESAYESLCVFYVAMTRARRGLYLFIPEPSETSEALNPAVLARAALNGSEQDLELGGVRVKRLYEAGDENWAASRPELKPPETVAAAVSLLQEPGPRVRLQRRLPSETGHGRRPAAQIFSGGAAANFGTALHAVFEQVDWSGEGIEDRAVTDWRDAERLPREIRDAVEAEFRKAMAVGEIRSALAKPDGAVELWREKRFEMVLDDGWISGCFDRVVIRLDAAGKAESADILDYKSNDVQTEEQIAEAVESYRPQLNLYRRCLSLMLDLSEKQITATLIVSKPGRAVRL